MSTACLACALLDHSAAVAASSHASARLPQNKQLVILEGSLAQSAACVVREMVRRNEARGEASLVVCLAHTPAELGASAQLNFARTPSLTLRELEYRLRERIQCTSGRVMLVLDALDALLDKTGCSVPEAHAMIARLTKALPNYSRLVVVSAVDASPAALAVVASLSSPLFWSGQKPEQRMHDGPWTHATLFARVHPVALIRHLYTTYGLTPPTSSPPLRRAAYAEAGQTPPPVDEHKLDPRFWSVLHSVASRGPFGVDGAKGGWWNASRTTHLHDLDALAAPHSPELSAEQVLGLHNDTSELYTKGIGFLELHATMAHGKYAEELAACAHDPQPQGGARLRLLALDMGTSVPSATSQAVAADPHTSLVQQLPFNLQETGEQRERREQVALPYAYQLHGAQEIAPESAWRGSTGQSAIFFEPESEDDEDDDDPDDDLDV